MQDEIFLTLTAEIVLAHVANNAVPVAKIGSLIQDVHAALATLSNPTAREPEVRKPAVSVRASIKPDHLVCLECGRKMKMMKRHVRVSHDLSPADYRARYGLAADYPMAAPDHTQRRSELAKRIGLGRLPAGPSPAKRGRKASAPTGRRRSR